MSVRGSVGLVRSAGRRPGPSHSKDEILAAASRLFAERGYAGATIRSIAVAADVNPALIRHYFGSKDQLFLAVLQFPVNPPQLVAELLAAGPRDRFAERFAERFITTWRDPQVGPALQAAIRRAVADPDYARLLRHVAETVFLPKAAALLGVSERDVAAAVASLLGLMIAATILHLTPLASADDRTLVALVAPAIDRYLSVTT